MRSKINVFARIVILAVLYVITGKLGLMLAVPPGYATLIWPPSGIALGMLLVYGYEMGFGVLLGSFILNAFVSGGLSLHGGVIWAHCVVPIEIALGSTLQAIVGKYLLERFLSFPVELTKKKNVLKFFVIAGPLTCLVAATSGSLALYGGGIVSGEKVISTWVNWWSGDFFGVLIFLPVILLFFGKPSKLRWKRSSLSLLPGVALIGLLLPLGLTFYGWKIISESTFQKGKDAFERLALENEESLLWRIESYRHALLGVAGFVQGSLEVSRREWQNYVEELDIKNNFPGTNGFGWIVDLAGKDANDFVNKARKDGAPNYAIHPQTATKALYVVLYVAPGGDNSDALGLNIGFEQRRLEAAEYARASGNDAITKAIILVQDKEKTPGFLLMHPVYKSSELKGEKGQKKFAGWIYSPLLGKKFLTNLSASERDMLSMRIYDGGAESAGSLIYATDDQPANSNFTVRKTISVMQQKWLVVFSSTPAFDRNQTSYAPVLTLSLGLFLCLLVTVLFLTMMWRNLESSSSMVENRIYILPLLTFAVATSLAFYLYQALDKKEMNHVQSLLEEEAKKIEQLIQISNQQKFLAIKRMAQRWRLGDADFERDWRKDAHNSLETVAGLTAIEWIGSDFNTRWIESKTGNVPTAVSLSSVDQDMQASTRESSISGFALAPPSQFNHVPVLIGYAPLASQGKSDGYLAGVFSIDKILSESIDPTMRNNYVLTLFYKGTPFFQNRSAASAAQSVELRAQRDIQMLDAKWTLRLQPTPQFIQKNQSFFPIVVLVAGLIIAMLLALTARYLILFRIKSGKLKEATSRLTLATDAGGIGVWEWDLASNALLWDSRMYILYGISKSQFSGAYQAWENGVHPDDKQKTTAALQEAVAGVSKFDASFRVVWPDTSVHHIRALAQLVRDQYGEAVKMIGVNWDITREKELETMKNEFISTVAHEIRTPLTAIKVSLAIMRDTKTYNLPPDVAMLISMASDSSSRLIRLINDILDVEKIEAGKMELRFEIKDAKDLVQKAIDSSKVYAQTSFKVHLAAKELWSAAIKVDPDKFQQVMTNLISNACKFSPENGVVTIACLEIDSKVRIMVSDQGPGIPEEFQTRIFQKFAQADSSDVRKQGGTGLGLNICKAIVEKMGGKIDFESKTGGTTFYFDLPIFVPAYTERSEVEESSI